MNVAMVIDPFPAVFTCRNHFTCSFSWLRLKGPYIWLFRPSRGL